MPNAKNNSGMQQFKKASLRIFIETLTFYFSVEVVFH